MTLSTGEKSGSVVADSSSKAVEDRLAETMRVAANPAELERAYRVCRDIARKQAKNFYYAFVALPKPKRDAICAVYAFMRHADDLSDDESRPHAERRIALDTWLDAWHRADTGEPTSDPVFVALADARRRFAIPMSLLDELVEGTTMDLRHAAGAANRIGSEAVHQMHFDLYPTFEELYRYCYLVASVVGLVCIRIFGYTDKRAERLAEETGIAFQLTNILRDVREDALRGRVYLPVEDMERLGVTPEELAHLEDGGRMTLNQRELLEMEAQRAERYYQSGLALLPLIAADSRPALWVLIRIYRGLLQRIQKANYDVFSTRVSVPIYQKLWILLRGLVRIACYRIGGGW